ncbi:MAG: NFACT family protein, partial [Lachnospiraceae bacterium]|nr:NFACT family protein [Lachnospiraceae bacterium]
MAFDGITIHALTKELNDTLAGGRISKIAQPESDELLITVKAQGANHRLLISADPSLPLLYFTASNKPSPMTAPGFCMLLRKHIGSGRIIKV